MLPLTPLLPRRCRALRTLLIFERIARRARLALFAHAAAAADIDFIAFRRAAALFAEPLFRRGRICRRSPRKPLFSMLMPPPRYVLPLIFAAAVFEMLLHFSTFRRYATLRRAMPLLPWLRHAATPLLQRTCCCFARLLSPPLLSPSAIARDFAIALRRQITAD